MSRHDSRNKVMAVIKRTKNNKKVGLYLISQDI